MTSKSVLDKVARQTEHTRFDIFDRQSRERLYARRGQATSIDDVFGRLIKILCVEVRGQWQIASTRGATTRQDLPQPTWPAPIKPVRPFAVGKPSTDES